MITYNEKFCDIIVMCQATHIVNVTYQKIVYFDFSVVRISLQLRNARNVKVDTRKHVTDQAAKEQTR